MFRLAATLALSLSSFSAHADQVASHAAAINDLREIQIQYLQDATVSGDALVKYGYTKSRQAGSEAACDSISVEDLPSLAEETTEFINEKLKPLMNILRQVTRDSVQVPIGGTMRDNFLSGFEKGCGATSIIGEDNVTSGLEALESASLIQNEIERRKSKILQILTGDER